MDEPLLGLETDKASMDLTAEAEGELEIIIPEGTVAVGDIIGKINTEAKQSESKPKTEEKAEEKVGGAGGRRDGGGRKHLRAPARGDIRGH